MSASPSCCCCAVPSSSVSKSGGKIPSGIKPKTGGRSYTLDDSHTHTHTHTHIRYTYPSGPETSLGPFWCHEKWTPFHSPINLMMNIRTRPPIHRLKGDRRLEQEVEKHVESTNHVTVALISTTHRLHTSGPTFSFFLSYQLAGATSPSIQHRIRPKYYSCKVRFTQLAGLDSTPT